MIDEDFKVFLIEVNTNPCLELSSTLLSRVIPNMIENVFKFFVYSELQLILFFPLPKRIDGSEERKTIYQIIWNNKIDLNSFLTNYLKEEK